MYSYSSSLCLTLMLSTLLIIVHSAHDGSEKVDAVLTSTTSEKATIYANKKVQTEIYDKAGTKVDSIDLEINDFVYFKYSESSGLKAVFVGGVNRRWEIGSTKVKKYSAKVRELIRDSLGGVPRRDGFAYYTSYEEYVYINDKGNKLKGKIKNPVWFEQLERDRKIHAPYEASQEYYNMYGSAEQAFDEDYYDYYGFDYEQKQRKILEQMLRRLRRKQSNYL